MNPFFVVTLGLPNRGAWCSLILCLITGRWSCSLRRLCLLVFWFLPLHISNILSWSFGLPLIHQFTTEVCKRNPAQYTAVKIPSNALWRLFCCSCKLWCTVNSKTNPSLASNVKVMYLSPLCRRVDNWATLPTWDGVHQMSTLACKSFSSPQVMVCDHAPWITSAIATNFWPLLPARRKEGCNGNYGNPSGFATTDPSWGWGRGEQGTQCPPTTQIEKIV